MKKIFMSVAVVCMMAVAAGMVSCNPNRTQCWLLRGTWANGQVEERYFYGSGEEADAQLEIMHQNGANKIHRESAAKSKSDCHN